MADVVAMRWQGHCYHCGEDREVESRPDHAMQALCDECAAKPHEKPQATPYMVNRQPASKKVERLVTTAPAAAYPARPIQWLHRPYLPLGKIAILAGPPGQGKSQVALWLAAAVTRGELLGDVVEPADVVIVSAEDDPNDTIIPRLIAVGADFDHVFILDVKDRETDGSLLDAALALPNDGAKLSEALEHRRVRLVILDPISAFLDAAVDSYKNASVRRALQPLKTLAEQQHTAVLAITHLSKGMHAGEPLDRVIDSVAFSALARSVMLMSADPDDEDGTRGSSKVLLLAKANLAPPGEHALRFELQALAVPTEVGPAPTSRVNLMGAANDIRSSDLLSPPDERSELMGAVDFLRRELRDGWRPSEEVRKTGASLAIGDRTLKRARTLVCARAQKESGDKRRWWVGLRGTLPPWEGGQPAGGRPLGTVVPLGGEGGQGGQEYAPTGVGPLSKEDKGANDVAYLRERDARLGERWEDDE